MKTLLYQIRAHKLAYALNVLGLSIALAAFYLFATQVEFNWTYNHSIKDYERAYRVEVGGFTQNLEWSCYMIRFFESSMKEMAHVEDVVSHNMVQWRLPVFVNGNQFNDIMSLQIGDPGLDFFGVKMLSGTSKYATRTQAVVTKSVAEQLFGTADAVGRRFSIPQVKHLTVGEDASSASQNDEGELEVVGVAEDMPANSLLQNGISYWLLHQRTMAPELCQAYTPPLVDIPSVIRDCFSHCAHSGDWAELASGYAESCGKRQDRMKKRRFIQSN